MVLVIDIGNTQIAIGVFDGERLVETWRISTDNRRTADEYSLIIRSLILVSGLELRRIDGVGICSVVPPLTPVFCRATEMLFGVKPMVVQPGIKTGMPILYENPAEVGSDRIANAVAAYDQAKGPVIIVDFGTATTFCAVSGKGEYLGGSILPGVQIGAEALFERAARLPRVEVKKPESVIGRTTVSSIQSGLFFGHICVVEGMVRLIAEKLAGRRKPKVFATGGLAQLFASETEVIDSVDPDLTLKGIRLLYEKNR